MPSRSFFDVPDQAANATIICNFGTPERLHHIDKAIAKNIAPLVDAGSLAHLVGVSPKLIFGIIRNPSRHYNYFPLRKKDGRIRAISAPKTYLKVIQWWILDNILKKLPHDPCVTGFVQGRGIFANAKVHFGARHLYNTDLKDFFPNIPLEKVHDFWVGLDAYPVDVCDQLSHICTLNGGLPQGAPTSPIIANMIASTLDRDLDAYCKERGWNYSRYADDITISSESRIGDATVDDVNRLIVRNGFTENKSKRRFRGNGQRMEVTGLVINQKIQFPRRWRKTARAIFFQAIRSPSTDKQQYDLVSGYVGALISCNLDEDCKLLLDGKRALVALNGARSGAEVSSPTVRP